MIGYRFSKKGKIKISLKYSLISCAFISILIIVTNNYPQIYLIAMFLGGCSILYFLIMLLVCNSTFFVDSKGIRVHVIANLVQNVLWSEVEAIKIFRVKNKIIRLDILQKNTKSPVVLDTTILKHEELFNATLEAFKKNGNGKLVI